MVQQTFLRWHAVQGETVESPKASFLEACRTGDLPGLTALLAEDVTLWSDGGGKARAAVKPIHGLRPVAGFLLGLVSRAPEGFSARLGRVNGQWAIITEFSGRVQGVVLPQVAEGRIQGIRIVVNPDKLGAVTVAQDSGADSGLGGI